MIAAALLLFVVYLAAGFGLRTWLHVRRTGDTGFRGLSGRPAAPSGGLEHQGHGRMWSTRRC